MTRLSPINREQVAEQHQGAFDDQFGRQGFAALTALMGYYAMLSFNANAVELDLPGQMTEPVLPI